jgi:hypothetical protein
MKTKSEAPASEKRSQDLNCNRGYISVFFLLSFFAYVFFLLSGLTFARKKKTDLLAIYVCDIATVSIFHSSY